MFLVTGGAGFIGSHLAERLVRDGGRVRILDNFATGNLANLHAIQRHIEIVDGDVRDEACVRRALQEVEVVFHEAALSSVSRSIEDPATTFAINVTGTLNVLLAARDAGTRRLVFASSAAVYGDSPALPKHEAMLPDPLSPYAVSKLTGEHLCAVFTRLYGLETVALRYFNVFGPRQDPASPYSGVVSRFVAALQRGDQPVVFGDGEQTRDFVYVDNVVDANLRAATAAVAGTVVNVASGRSVSLNALLSELAGRLGAEPEAEHRPGRPGDIRHSSADIAQARALIGYEPAVSLEAGLARLVTPGP
jgi:nucleoside-diphosphate-sugar epimerase